MGGFFDGFLNAAQWNFPPSRFLQRRIRPPACPILFLFGKRTEGVGECAVEYGGKARGKSLFRPHFLTKCENYALPSTCSAVEKTPLSNGLKWRFFRFSPVKTVEKCVENVKVLRSHVGKIPGLPLFFTGFTEILQWKSERKCGKLKIFHIFHTITHNRGKTSPKRNKVHKRGYIQAPDFGKSPVRRITAPCCRTDTGP